MTKRSKRLKQINASIGHNKRKRRLFYLGSSISMVLVVFSAMLINNYIQNFQSNEVAIYNFDLCQQQNHAKIAQELDLDYIFDDRFGEISMVLTADKASMKAFNQHAQLYNEQSIGTLSNFKQNCPLTDVKHHVANINNNLVAHIPDDADYVSYDPNNDNAVYCHYLIGKSGGSQCFYVRLNDDRLIIDDISDMERANLVAANQHYSLRKDVSDFYYVRSTVEIWTEKPTLYGMVFQTHYDGNRWGMTQNY